MFKKQTYFKGKMGLLSLKDIAESVKNKNKSGSKIHFFDVVIILLILDIAALTVIFFYMQRINSFSLPQVNSDYLEISSIPLTTDLNSINASAEAYVVFDTETRTVVAGKNHNLRFSPASTAKVMTAIVALQHYKLDDYLIVPYSVYSVEGSKMDLVPGEKVSVKNLLYGLMLPSGNDAAHTLAYYYPNGVKGFVDAMNSKAKSLKLENTRFLDPAGYEDGNYTTGSELARLGAYAMENQDFADIVKTRATDVYNAEGTHHYYLENLNELLYYENIEGIKTGFTNEAGGVLLTAIRKNGKLFTVAVLKSNDRFADTKDLMEFIQEKVDFSVPQND